VLLLLLLLLHQEHLLVEQLVLLFAQLLLLVAPVLLVVVAQIVGLELHFDLVDLGVHGVELELHARQLLSDTHRGHGEPPWSRSVCGEKKTGVVGVVSFVDGATGQTVGPTGGQNAARDV
jgi:hypothetical protein